jgi:diguanylate cyclase (GGDEF)-like protein
MDTAAVATGLMLRRLAWALAAAEVALAALMFAAIGGHLPLPAGALPVLAAVGAALTLALVAVVVALVRALRAAALRSDELAAAAQAASARLGEAIEALPDGFALYDADDRLAVYNRRYREIYAASAPAIEVGTRFEDLLRYGLARGQYPEAAGREEAWLAERLHRHRHPAGPEVQQLPANRWLRVDERRTASGGIAGVRIDISDLVRREQELQRLNAELDTANARLTRLSDTDALTGLANRRQFDRCLEQEWARALRHALPLSLLLVDIDHFKRYNDCHGHVQGDDCLRRVGALLLQGARRAGDVVARYGGEEFALLLPHTDAHEALAHARRCQLAFDAAAIAHGDSPVAAHVTCSIGVATLASGAEYDSPRAFLLAADAALYRAKQRGRMRLVTAEALVDDGDEAAVRHAGDGGAARQ